MIQIVTKKAFKVFVLHTASLLYGNYCYQINRARMMWHNFRIACFRGVLLLGLKSSITYRLPEDFVCFMFNLMESFRLKLL